jgi:hypothetical protein
MANQDKEAFDEDGNLSNQNQEIRGDNTIKDPDEWTTGAEPMTGAQHSYLKTLSDEAGEEFDEKLSKADASKRIDELQHKTGRGLSN